MLARQLAERYRKPLLVVDLSAADAVERAHDMAAWAASSSRADGVLALGVGGPRESEAPGIYGRAATLLHSVFDGLV